MKRIFVACGSGVATSQTVASKIQSMCEDEGLDVSVEVVENILFLYFDKDSNNYKKYFNAILGGLDDWNVDNTNLISFKNEFYYYTKALNFSNFEEFEKLKELIEA